MFEFNFKKVINNNLVEITNSLKKELESQEDYDKEYYHARLNNAILQTIEKTLEEYHNQLMNYLNEK